MMIPNDSNHPPQFFPSISQNIDSLAQMLLSISLTYEQETCHFLLDKIRGEISLTPHLEKSLETLQKAIKNPSDFEAFAVQQALVPLRNL